MWFSQSLTMVWYYHLVFILLGILMTCGLLPRLPFLIESAVVGYLTYMNFLLSQWIGEKYLSPLIISFYGLCFYAWRSFLDLVSFASRIRDTRSALIDKALDSKTATSDSDLTPKRSGLRRNCLPTNSVVQSTYKYQALSGESEIRLLELLPTPDGEAAKPLEGRILHTCLDEAPPYVALSYAWEDDALDGRSASYTHPPILHCSPAGSLTLTHSLIRALLGMRHEKHSEMLWVDQICIDQENKVERSSQVALMKRIYSNALYVRVWLGDDTGNGQGERAFKLATQIANSVDETDILTQPLSLLEMDAQTCAQYRIPPLEEATDDYLALGRLLDRPWFVRSWIVQEVSFNCAVVFYGSAEIPFASLSKALICCGIPLRLPSTASLRASEAFVAMVGAAVSLARDIGRPSRKLLDILVQHRCCKAKMSQDKIFAFLNLADDAVSKSVRADYSLVPRDVYLNTAVAMLKNYTDLDILSVAKPLVDVSTLRPTKTGQSVNSNLTDQSSDLDTTLFDLPSWVPNWEIHTAYPSLRSRGLYGEYFGDFRATKNSNREVQFRGPSTQLGLHGYILDQIVDRGDVIGLGHTDDASELYGVFKQWERLCKARSGRIYSATGETILTAYCMTLTCGGEAVIARGIDSINDAVSSVWNSRVPGRPSPDDEPFSAQYLFYLLSLRNRSIIKRLGFDPSRNLFLYSIMVLGFSFVSVIMDDFLSLLGGQRAATAMSQMFQLRLAKSITGRRFIRTQSGYIGLSVIDAELGDHIALFAGGAVPLVVRETGETGLENKEWKLVGEAYVHGIMFGEGFEEDKCQSMWLV